MSDSELDQHLEHIQAEKSRRESTLIIGAAGAIGKRLCAALASRGHRVIASDRMEKMPGSIRRSIGKTGVCVGNVDVRNLEGIRKLFRHYADTNTTVWNLAAPLSVETAMDPAVAESVTVGGMQNVLTAMGEVGARRICFTDSIGSFGGSSPRVGATAAWLTMNPDQDPGSDYGRQKRACRELMEAFRREHSGDSRFAVLPGVLHTNSVWGNGTTEYALDALLAAPHQATRLGLPVGDSFVCPLDPDVRLPMIFVSDLMKGLIALQEAPKKDLKEPQCGYCIPGLSFSPNELFAEIRKAHPGFGFRVQLNENMDKFAHIWPNDLDTTAPLRDLSYSPQVGLRDMVTTVLSAHEDRNMQAAKAFKAIDTDGSLTLTRDNMEEYIRRHEVQGRESYTRTGQSVVSDLVDRLMKELDPDMDGLVSWGTFSEWNRHNSFDKIVQANLSTPPEGSSLSGLVWK